MARASKKSDAAPAPDQMPDDGARARARELVESAEAAAVWVDVSALKQWAKNPRKNTKAIAAVAKSITRFGFASPIIARKADGEIIGGHTRLAAALKLGLTRVPVRYLDLDPAEAHLLALADNKLGEIADWDDALLVEVLSGYTTEDAAAAGFTPEDLDKLAGSLAGDDEAAGADDDGIKYEEKFAVVVSCTDERDQQMTFEKLTGLGFTCKVIGL